MAAIYTKTITVGPESIDILKHVNNREYLRWMEEVAIEHASSLGWGPVQYIKRGEAWVAREHWIEYLRPTFLGEELTIYTWVQGYEGSRSLRRYAIKRDNRIVCTGATEWAYISMRTGRAMDLPEEIAAVFTPIPDGDERLVGLGLDRPMRYLPYSEKV